MQASTALLAHKSPTHIDDDADQHQTKSSDFMAFGWPWEREQWDRADALYDLTVVCEAAVRQHHGKAHQFDRDVLDGKFGYLSRVRGQELGHPGVRTFAEEHIGSSNLKTLLGIS